MISIQSEQHKTKRKTWNVTTFTHCLLDSQVDEDAFQRLHRLSHLLFTSGRQTP